MTWISTIIMRTTPDTRHHRVPLIITWCDVIRKKVSMPWETLTLLGVNCLHLLGPARSAKNSFLSTATEFPFKTAALTMDCGHLGQPGQSATVFL